MQRPIRSRHSRATLPDSPNAIAVPLSRRSVAGDGLVLAPDDEGSASAGASTLAPALAK